MVQASSAGKNLWVAASDGDIDRVRYLIENEGLTANSKDSNSYTPMHAAASYAHLELLEYLISIGGDINLRDADGDSPLYVVESIEMARWMIERGADPTLKNDDGLTAAEYLEDEHPEISTYLRSLSGDPNQNQNQNPTSGAPASSNEVSALAVDEYTSHQTTSLLEDTKRIMEEAERDGTDPDERLREVVERAVRQGFSFGGQLGDAAGAGQAAEMDGQAETKRTREDE